MSVMVLSQVGLWILTIANLLLVLVLYRQFGLVAMSTAEGHDNDGLPVGEEVRPLPVLDPHASGGKPHDKDLGGKWSIVFFGTPNCEPCVGAMDQINEAMADLDARHIEVVAALHAEGSEILEFVEEKGYSFSPVVDSGGMCSVMWEVKVTPFAFLVDPDRRIRAKALVGGVKRVTRFLERVMELSGSPRQLADLTR